ncbi:MAG: methylated-DNA--[protein]-cysteine S-methyltransferase [Pseudomonadota bacterium]
MSTYGFVLFDTGIGRCAVVWTQRGIVGSQLPEPDDASAKARLLKRFPRATEATPPAEIHKAVEGVIALLSGQRRDLQDIALDMSEVTPFQQRVYAVARTIPPGETATYGEIAQRMGEPREAARAVGEAMGRNPFPILMPCHRVLGANGKPGGFSAPGGLGTKLKMLQIEGAKVGETPTLFDELPLAVKPR